jgi:hypothetical protein
MFPEQVVKGVYSTGFESYLKPFYVNNKNKMISLRKILKLCSHIDGTEKRMVLSGFTSL